jgi:hypothetical protein
MPRPRPSYHPELRRKLMELARAGRPPESWVKKFEPCGQTIRNLIQQAERVTGTALDLIKPVTPRLQWQSFLKHTTPHELGCLAIGRYGGWPYQSSAATKP